MANPAKGELRFKYNDRSFCLIFNFDAIEHFESATGQSIAPVIDALANAEEGGHPPKVSTLVRLLLAGLSTHHPELTPDDVMPMMADKAVQAALGGAFGTAMSAPEEAGNGAAPAAKPGKASKPKRGTGKAGSGSRSRAA